MFFARTLFRVAAPLREVSWADFILADVLTSLSKALSDLERAACHLLAGPVMRAHAADQARAPPRPRRPFAPGARQVGLAARRGRGWKNPAAPSCWRARQPARPGRAAAGSAPRAGRARPTGRGSDTAGRPRDRRRPQRRPSLCPYHRFLWSGRGAACPRRNAAGSERAAAAAAQMCGSASLILPLGLALPYAWRLAQCLRVYRDTGARPQLFNALKYSTAFPVILFSALKYQARRNSTLTLSYPYAAGLAGHPSTLPSPLRDRRGAEPGLFKKLACRARGPQPELPCLRAVSPSRPLHDGKPVRRASKPAACCSAAGPASRVPHHLSLGSARPALAWPPAASWRSARAPRRLARPCPGRQGPARRARPRR
jgi:hypothetical protein